MLLEWMRKIISNSRPFQPFHESRAISTLSLVALSFIGMAMLTGCAEAPDRGDAKYIVSVSIPPQAYLVERIAWPDVRVHTLVQGNESPATYQPSDRQVSDVLRSDLFFRIGVPFERGAWFEVISGSETPMKVVDLRDGISLRLFGGCGHPEHQAAPLETACTHDHGEAATESCGHDHAPGESCDHATVHDHGNLSVDPHIWLTPESLINMSLTITDAFCELNPEGAAQYRANQKKLQADLDSLHDDLSKIMRPHAGKRFYIYHPAWGYFCDKYGIEQKAIELEGKEPSDEELTRIQEQMRADKAKVIFIQPQIEGKSVAAVANAVGVRVEMLDPLAKDVIQNLRRAARVIAESFDP